MLALIVTLVKIYDLKMEPWRFTVAALGISMMFLPFILFGKRPKQ